MDPICKKHMKLISEVARKFSVDEDALAGPLAVGSECIICTYEQMMADYDPRHSLETQAKVMADPNRS